VPPFLPAQMSERPRPGSFLAKRTRFSEDFATELGIACADVSFMALASSTTRGSSPSKSKSVQPFERAHFDHVSKMLEPFRLSFFRRLRRPQ